MIVWTWLRDGDKTKMETGGFYRTKKSLLISYDMMPLRGLRQTERVLKRKGHIVKGEFILSPNGPWLVPCKNGCPDVAFMDFTGSANSYESRFRSLCFYLGDKLNAADPLRQYYWRSIAKDKRFRRPLLRLKGRCETIVALLGYRIESCEFKKMA